MSLINLLPDDYLNRQKQRRTNVLCICLLAAVMAAVLAAAGVSEVSYRHTRQVASQIDQSYADAGRLIQQLQELEASRGKMLNKATLTAGLMEKVPRSYLLATIANSLPAHGSVTKFELTGKRGQMMISKENQKRPEVPPLEAVITLTGNAGTDVEVAQFIAAMARCPLLETVDLVYSQEKKANVYVQNKKAEEAVVREFQVVMRLRRDADVRSLTAAAPAVTGGAGVSSGVPSTQAAAATGNEAKTSTAETAMRSRRAPGGGTGPPNATHRVWEPLPMLQAQEATP